MRFHRMPSFSYHHCGPAIPTGRGPTPPANFHLPDGTCYNITTNMAFTGNVTVTMPFDYSGHTSTEIKLMHYDAGTSTWVDITSDRDTVNGTISGVTTSLSPFGVFEELKSFPPITSTPASSGWSLGLMALVGGGVLLAFRRSAERRI